MGLKLKALYSLHASMEDAYSLAHWSLVLDRE
jgi:hypothetical protein